MRTGSPALCRWLLAICLTAGGGGWLFLAGEAEASRSKQKQESLLDQVREVQNLARELREEIEKNGEHVLSIKSLKLSAKLEAEARKLRKEARR